MDLRRHRSQVQTHDQENVSANKGKSNIPQPSKRVGLTVRGALGELNSNEQIQRDLSAGNVNISTAEFEKKATLNRGAARKCSHVHSKVDTGRARKQQAAIIPSAQPPLCREESTAALRAFALSRSALKEIQNNKVEVKDSNSKNEAKKSVKLPTIKENAKTSESSVAISKQDRGSKIKDQTKKLEKLKLAEESGAVCESSKLPLMIIFEDIDAKDKNSPILLSIYVNDIYRYLMELEEKYPIAPDHLKNQAAINGKMRATLMDWLVEVQQQFCLLLETLQLTIGIIDRYLQAVPNVPRNRLQLVGVAALFVATKYEEMYAPDVDDFVYVTNDSYNKCDVLRCEREILSALGFSLARPVPLSFLRRFVKAAHGTIENHHLAKYFVELCLIEYCMAHYRPSQLAAAAMCLSLHLLSRKRLVDVWTPTLALYSGYTFTVIKPIIRKIAIIVLNVEKSKHKAVYTKYLNAKLAMSSALPQLKGKAIKELVKMPAE